MKVEKFDCYVILTFVRVRLLFDLYVYVGVDYFLPHHYAGFISISYHYYLLFDNILI